MPKNDDNRQVRCSFCGKRQDQVKRLIAGPNVFICDECVELCLHYLDDGTGENTREEAYNRGRAQGRDQSEPAPTLLKPREIKAMLDEYVIGQDRAKAALAVAVYNHYKRVFFSSNVNDGVDIVACHQTPCRTGRHDGPAQPQYL